MVYLGAQDRLKGVLMCFMSVFGRVWTAIEFRDIRMTLNLRLQ